jgi:hypothetical protein
MRELARRLVVPVVILVALSAGGIAFCGLPGDTLHQEGLVGTYVVNGEDPNGVEYSGTVTITSTDTAGRYVVEWIVTGTIQRGDATLDGDRLSVVWTTVTSGRGDASGTAEYTVGDDGALRGTRTIDGVDLTGTEEIFPET